MLNKSILPILIVVAGLVLLLVWLAQRSAERDQQVAVVDQVERALPADAPAPATPPQAATVAESRQPESAAAPGPRPTERGVVELVKEWLGAWSEQRVDDYLRCYARTFVPEDGVSRGQWEARRRERIAAPRFVRVAITGLETELLDIGSARATFLQHYRSDGYSDTVRKTLDLVWEDGRWRIRRELSSGAP